jgi:hypothetical protein
MECESTGWGSDQSATMKANGDVGWGAFAEECSFDYWGIDGTVEFSSQRAVAFGREWLSYSSAPGGAHAYTVSLLSDGRLRVDAYVWSTADGEEDTDLEGFVWVEEETLVLNTQAEPDVCLHAYPPP